MNRIVYSSMLLTVGALIVVSPVEAKLLKPAMNGEEKEILIVNSKRRLYYPIKSDGLQYALEGPMRLEFISRYPVLKKKKKSLRVFTVTTKILDIYIIFIKYRVL